MRTGLQRGVVLRLTENHWRRRGQALTGGLLVLCHLLISKVQIGLRMICVTVLGRHLLVDELDHQKEENENENEA